ncbi:MAG: hypothetical protein PUC47_11985 [Oscillospiraceae bacterium]|nr:hypothetical protein [Oscillospiraceae bacterium]
MVNCLLAGIPVAFDNRFDELEALCRGYETDLPPAFRISVSAAELEEERKQQPGEFSDGYLETVCCYRKAAMALLDRDAFVLHASVVALDGEGYGFLAPSGVGKTTQTRLWQQHFGQRLRVINGDKPLIRMESGGFRADGTPWQGKENLGCNASVPLKTLFLLNRSDTPGAAPAGQEQVVERLFRQLLLPREPERMVRLLNLADRLVSTVLFYELNCDMTETSVLCAYQAAKGGASK